MKRNILLFFVLVVLSPLLAIPFGYLLNSYIFIISGGFATFSLPTDLSAIINGLPVSYLFLTPLLFIILGKSKKLLVAIILSLPMLIFSYIVSPEYLFWSLIFFISGIILAKLINIIISKFKRPNPPMVIK